MHTCLCPPHHILVQYGGSPAVQSSILTCELVQLLCKLSCKCQTDLLMADIAVTSLKGNQGAGYSFAAACHMRLEQVQVIVKPRYIVIVIVGVAHYDMSVYLILYRHGGLYAN